VMSIFTVIERKKKSLIGKVFNREPKGNGIAEITELLSKYENDILSISLRGIENICKQYDINPYKEFELNRKSLFLEYVTHVLNDLHIDKLEIEQLSHLKNLLFLTDDDMASILTGKSMLLFQEKAKEFVSDGALDSEELDKLESLRNSLILNEEVASKIIELEATEKLNEYVKIASDDQRLSDDEMEEMHRLSINLKLESISITSISKSEFDLYRKMWVIENDNLPEVESPINLQKNEKLYFTSFGSWWEERVVTKRVGYANVNARIKIVKGVKLNLGSLKAKPIKEDVLKKIHGGSFYLTNKRILLVSQKGTKNIRLNKILNIKIYSDGIDIIKDAGKPAFLKMEDVKIFYMILNRLLFKDND